MRRWGSMHTMHQQSLAGRPSSASAGGGLPLRWRASSYREMSSVELAFGIPGMPAIPNPRVPGSTPFPTRSWSR